MGKTGYLVRMDHGREVKKICERKPKGRKRVGRPRMRWLKMFKIGYRVDRKEWVSVIKEV